MMRPDGRSITSTPRLPRAADATSESPRAAPEPRFSGRRTTRLRALAARRLRGPPGGGGAAARAAHPPLAPATRVTPATRARVAAGARRAEWEWGCGGPSRAAPLRRVKDSPRGQLPVLGQMASTRAGTSNPE
ncbi:uncharacterized protein LOC144581657 [Callithrix jacchus]